MNNNNHLISEAVQLEKDMSLWHKALLKPYPNVSVDNFCPKLMWHLLDLRSLDSHPTRRATRFLRSQAPLLDLVSPMSDQQLIVENGASRKDSFLLKVVLGYWDLVESNRACSTAMSAACV